MNQLSELFPTICSHSVDVYVADYTNLTQSARKVEISEEPFGDISYFHLRNPRRVRLVSVNLECNKSLVQGTKQCECLFRSSNAKKKPWLLLLELKYCLDKEVNLKDNAEYALTQLNDTHQVLISKGGEVFTNNRVYMNISIPDHSHRQPFSNFIYPQNMILKYFEVNKIQLLGYNSLEVLNESYIKVPHIEV